MIVIKGEKKAKDISILKLIDFWNYNPFIPLVYIHGLIFSLRGEYPTVIGIAENSGYPMMDNRRSSR